eukprot:905865_1
MDMAETIELGRLAWNCMAEMDTDWLTLSFIFFNFSSSVGLIFLNKYLATHFGFTFVMFITACHFFVTFICMKVCANYGIFKPKTIRLTEVIPISLAFIGYVGFNNLSLIHNSIGFYQITKVMTTPMNAWIQLQFFGVALHNHLKLTIIPICFGVAMALGGDLELNFLGATYALLGLISSSMYQIWVKSKQKDLGVNAFQLLLYQAPVAATMVLAMIPFVEQLHSTVDAEGELLAVGLLDYDWSVGVIAILALSCMAAFCVNLSIFLVIGRTSPVTYTVTGHGKTCAILICGILFFGEEYNTQKIVGCLLAVFGIVAYTHLKLKIQEGWDSYASKETHVSSGGEEDIILIKKELESSV